MKKQSNESDPPIVTKRLSGKPEQNFGLREEEFEKMLERMKAGDEILFKRVFLSQFEDCMRYLMHRYQISQSKAYDVSMDALLKFRKRLVAGKISYGNMRFLFTRMASQFLSDSSKHMTMTLDESEKDRIDEPKVDEDTLDGLDKAWSRLCEDCRKILDMFYYQKINLKILATRFGKSEVALRKQKQRCLENLRKYFLKNHDDG